MRVVKIGLSVVIVIACLGLTQAYRYGKKISPSPPPGDLGGGGSGYGGTYGGGAVGGGGGPHGGFGSGGLPEYNDAGNFGGGGYSHHGHNRNGRHGFGCDDRGHAHGFQPQNSIGHETGLGAFDHDQGQRAIDFNERQRKVNIMFNILSKPREYEGGFNSGGGNHSTPNRQDSRIGVVSIVVGVSGGMGHGNRPGFTGIGGGSYSKSKGKDSGLGVVIMGGSYTPAGGQGSGLGTASMGGGVHGGDVGHGISPSYAGSGGGSHTPAGGQGSGLGTASMGGGVSGGDVGHGNRPSYAGSGGGSHTPVGGQGSGLGIASMGGGVSGSDLGYGGRPYNASSVVDKGQESIAGVYDVGYSVSPSDVANEHVGVQNVEHESGINGINKTGIGNGVSVKEIFQDQPLVTHLKAIIEHIIHNARQHNEDEEVEHNNNYKDEVLTSHLKGVKQRIHSGYNQESQGSSLDFTKDGILYMQLKGIIDKAINRAVNSESHTNDIM